jgi:pimeloyl-ACP methyl ester carboxylesterase
MNDRRGFLGLGLGASAAAMTMAGTATMAAAGTAAARTGAEASAPTGAPASAGPATAQADGALYAGIMGRGYARGPCGLVHFHDSAGLVQSRRGELPLVLLHQSPASARQFEAAFKPLVARGIRFVAIDTPGFGFSDPTPTLPRLEDWASSIVAVLDHLGLPKVDLLGHHTGALLATEVALQAPARVRRLVLNGAFPVTEAERAEYLAGAERSHARGKPVIDGSHLLNSFQIRVKMYGPDPDPAIITRIVAEKYQGLGPYWWGHNAAYRYDHAASIQRLALRTMILTNTGDDIYDLSRRAAALRPDFDYRELPGGTHDIVDQQPEAWSDAVVEFLRQPDRASAT